MSDYRRYFVKGGSYFFTVVTERRYPLFNDERAREILRDALSRCENRFPYRATAMVLLPDHLHTLWTLPPDDANYSQRWQWIKREFTQAWLAAGGTEQRRNIARRKERRRGIWQRRFHEHTIRDEADWEAHFDYIHYNPVKHGLAQRPRDWPWTTFHRWVKAGHYSIDWGAGLTPPDIPADGGE